MKRVVWIAGLLAVGLALPIPPCQAQVRNDLAVVYEPATGAMRLEFTGTGSLALTAFDVLSRGNGTVGTATATTQGVLTGAKASLPSAAFQMFNDQTGGVNGIYSQMWVASLDSNVMTLSDASPGTSNIWNFGAVAPTGWNQAFVNAAFVTDPDSSPNSSTNAGLGYFMFSDAAANGFQLGRVVVPGPSAIVIDVASGSKTQAEAGYPSISEAGSLTKTGAGTLVFNTANAYTGPTTVSAGTLQVTNAAGLGSTAVTVDTGATLAAGAGIAIRSPAVIVDGGTLSAGSLAVNATTGITSLAINAGTLSGSPAAAIGAGGTMLLAQDARVTVSVGSLAVTETSGGGRLDLGAGQVSIPVGGITAAALRADILAARNGGAWNGPTGITSSTAAAASPGTRAVGYVINADGSARVSFAAMGDVDLSGRVDVFDLVGINSSGTYGTGRASAWYQGDINYDGVTSVFDLIGVNSGGVYGRGNYFPAAPTLAGATTTGGINAVPEPAGMAAIAATMIGAAWLARRRRA